MTVELRLDRTASLAQTIHIRSHALVTDVSEAEGGDDAGLVGQSLDPLGAAGVGAGDDRRLTRGEGAHDAKGDGRAT